MICLGIDSSGKAAGVAVQCDDKLLYEVYLQAGLTHSETLLPLVDTALSSLRLKPCDIDLVGVNAGPGSFTGLRIGIAMAKGLCLPYNIPAVGVSTLESLATGIDGEGGILCALDARRSEVYYAMFTRNNGVLKRITKDTAAPAASLEQMCCKADKPLYIAGDGAKLCYEAFGERIGAILVNEHNRYSRAKGVCAVAMKEYAIGHAINADDLKPSYHRLSQAQRERQERENKIDG